MNKPTAPSMTPEHGIAVVERRTGISQHLLRAWERRYGVVEPERAAGGERLYSDADIERLRLVRLVSEAGRRVGQVAALSLDELCRRTGAAKSSVSVALRKLIGIRVVRRLPPRGDRRDYLEVIADPWTLLSEWNRLFFEPELEMWRSSGDRLDRALASAADAPSGEENAVIRARVRALSDFAEVAAQFLSQATRSQQEKPKARAIPIALEDAS